MDKDPDNRVFFDHGGLTAFDDGKNQLLAPAASPNAQREFQQEVRGILLVTFIFIQINGAFYRVKEAFEYYIRLTKSLACSLRTLIYRIFFVR